MRQPVDLIRRRSPSSGKHAKLDHWISKGQTREELEAHERVIEKGQRTFIEVGRALQAIRDGRGYKVAGFKTFEDYCQERWGWTRGRANHLIRASHYVEEMDTRVSIPSEGHARELMKLEPDQVVELAQEVALDRVSVRELAQKVRAKLGGGESDLSIPAWAMTKDTSSQRADLTKKNVCAIMRIQSGVSFADR